MSGPPPPPPPPPPPAAPKIKFADSAPSLTLALAGAVGLNDDSFDDEPSYVPPPPPPAAPTFVSSLPDISVAEGSSTPAAPAVADGSAPPPAAPSATTAAAAAHDGPIWTRAWTLGEMRNASSEWTLASDSGLLNFLKEFGAKLMQRTTDLEHHVEELVADTQRTNVMLRNTVNDFLLLSNTQFIESRVWGEEVKKKEDTAAPSGDNAEKKEGDAAQGTAGAQIIDERYRNALALGLKAMSLTPFGKQPKPAKEPAPAPVEGEAPVVEEESDESSSEEDFADAYNRRPLPFVIGTQEFDEDEMAGMFDPDRIEEDEKKEPSVEEEESDSSDVDNEPTEPYVPPQGDGLQPDGVVTTTTTEQQEDGGDVVVAQLAEPVASSDGLTEASGYDASGQPVSADGSNNTQPTVEDVGGVGPPRSLADELAARLGVAPPPTAPSAAPPSSTAAAVTPSEPEPAAPASTDPFAASSSAWGASLFDDAGTAPVDIFASSSKGGMFDTESIFSDSASSTPAVDIFSGTDDIFGPPKPAAPAAKPAAVAPASVATDIFGGDIFAPAAPVTAAAAPKPAPPTAAPLPAPAAQPKAGLFGGDDIFGSGNDLFGAPPPSKPAAPSTPAPAPVASPAQPVAAPAEASPTQDALSSSPARNEASGARKPVGGVSLFGGVDLFSGQSPGSPNVRRRSGSTSKNASRSATPANVPVGSSPPTFSAEPPVPAPAAVAPAVAPTPATAVAPAGPKRPAGAVSLFGGVDLFGGGDDTPKPAAASKPAPSKGLFGDDDLFGSKPAATTEKTPAAAPTPAPAPAASSSLFGQESDLFGSSAAPKPAAAAASKPAFGGGGLFGDDDLFGAPSKPAKPATAPAPAPAKPAETKAPSSGLFGDGDLFGAPSKPADVPAPAKAPAAASIQPVSGGLFGDDEVKKPASSAEVPVPARKAPVGGVSLFGGVDLFSSSPPGKKESPIKPAPPKASAPQVPAVESKKPASNPLFGEPLASGNDLFASKPASVFTPIVPPTASATTTTSTTTQAAPISSSPSRSAFSDPLGSASPAPKKLGGDSKVAALGAGLQFNPAMLMGGGRPVAKAAPVAEARVDDSGHLEIVNSGSRLGDEATQGAKAKATLRRKKGGKGRRAPTRRRGGASKDEDDEGTSNNNDEENEDWDEDDNTSNANDNNSTLSTFLPPPPSSSAPVAVAEDIFGSTSTPSVAASVPDIFGTPGSSASIDIFGNGPSQDVFDGPSIF